MGNVSRNGNIFEDVAIKAAVRAAATAGSLTLSGLQSVDGIALAEGDRVLVAAQGDPTTNGIWQASSGDWIRTVDASKNTDFIQGTLVLVAQGAQNAGQLFECTCSDSPVLIGSSQLTFLSQSAVQTAQQAASSATSQAIALGAMTFAAQAGKSFLPLQYVLIFETANPANAMLAQVSSYSGTALAVTSVTTSGSGTHADWSIVLANSAASAGRVPPTGTGNASGPGSAIAGHLVSYADNTGKNLADSGIPPGTLAGRNTLLYGDAGAASIPQEALVPGAAPLPCCGAQPNDNLHLVNDSSNPTRDINVSAGRCRDDSDATNLHLKGLMVKRLDTAWASGGVTGAPAGACDTGVKGAGQTWHIFLIAKRALVITAFSRSSGVATLSIAGHGAGVGGTVRAFGMGSGVDALAAISAVTTNSLSYANAGPDIALTTFSAGADVYDILASQSYATPSMPSGWSVKQCLGSFLTDGSGNIYAVTQIGDDFYLLTPVQLFSTTAPTSRTNFAVTAPLGVAVIAMLRAIATSAGGGDVLYSPLFAPDTTPSATFADIALGITVASATWSGAANLERPTDTSARISHRATNGAGGNITETVLSLGWRDPRRRMF